MAVLQLLDTVKMAPAYRVLPVMASLSGNSTTRKGLVLDGNPHSSSHVSIFTIVGLIVIAGKLVLFSSGIYPIFELK